MAEFPISHLAYVTNISRYLLQPPVASRAEGEREWPFPTRLHSWCIVDLAFDSHQGPSHRVPPRKSEQRNRLALWLQRHRTPGGLG